MKRGSELPIGQQVYFIDEYGILSHCIDHPSSFDEYLYVFESSDGLWATSWSREIWGKYPHRHPCITLFSLLYKKLGIRSC